MLAPNLRDFWRIWTMFHKKKKLCRWPLWCWYPSRVNNHLSSVWSHQNCQCLGLRKGACFTIKAVFSGIGIPIIVDWWWVLVSRHLYIETAPKLQYYNDTVYPKKYAHGFCFAVLCCGYTLTDFPISIRLTSLALWQSNDCPSASKATLMNMDKYFMWIHYERLHNHNKAKHNKSVCIFLEIYCMKLIKKRSMMPWVYHTTYYS